MTDEEIIAGLESGELGLDDLPPEYRNKKNIVMAAVKINGYDLQFASKALRDEEDVALAAVENAGGAIQYGSENVKNKKNIFIAAVKNDGTALYHAPDKFQQDKDVALAGVKNNWRVIQYLPKHLQEDKDIIQTTKNNLFELKDDLNSFFIDPRLYPTLVNDPEIKCLIKAAEKKLPLTKEKLKSFINFLKKYGPEITSLAIDHPQVILNQSIKKPDTNFLNLPKEIEDKIFNMLAGQDANNPGALKLQDLIDKKPTKEKKRPSPEKENTSAPVTESEAKKLKSSFSPRSTPNTPDSKGRTPGL